MKNKAVSAMTGASAVFALLHGNKSLTAVKGGHSEFCIPEVIENKRVKKSLLNVKISLDKILFCDRISLVEKYAPTQVGAFCFWGHIIAEPPAPGLLPSTPNVLKTKELSTELKSLRAPRKSGVLIPLSGSVTLQRRFSRTRTPR